MPLVVSTDRAFRSPSELCQLVLAIRNAPRHEMEDDWIEWKVGDKLLAKTCQVEMARHIIGFANRHPDHASATAEGTAYLVYGVEPGAMGGAKTVDIQQLDQGLERYLGADGPRWHATTVDVEGCTVMVVTIEAPRWGDSIYDLRKSFDGESKSYREGDIFIRKNGRTERADHASLVMLEERARRRNVQIELKLNWADGTSPIIMAVDDSPMVVANWIERERRRLLAPLLAMERKRSGTRALSVNPEFGELRRNALAELAGMYRDQRDPEEYRRSVDRYLKHAAMQLPGKIRALAVDGERSEVQVQITNPTERNLELVEVELSFPSGVIAYFESRDAWKDVDFPDALALYGQDSLVQRFLNSGQQYVSPFAHLAPPSGQIWNENACRIQFAPVHLRPTKRYLLPSFHLLAMPELAGGATSGRWRATSTGANGIAEGSITFQVSPDLVSGLALLDATKD